MMQEKTDLTVEERIIVAYLYHIRGVEQQDLAAAYNVNGGRVSETCTAMLMAAQDPKVTRKDLEDAAKRREEEAAAKKARRPALVSGA